MTEGEWARIGLEAAGWTASSFIGLLLGAWRGGRRSAHHDQKIKDDYTARVTALREETRTSMAEYERRADDRNDLLVQQFKESFEGIRRQIDQNRLDAEIRFLPKDDFKDWREEYRQDMQRIFDKLDSIPVGRRSQ